MELDRWHTQKLATKQHCRKRPLEWNKQGERLVNQSKKSREKIITEDNVKMIGTTWGKAKKREDHLRSR